MNVELYENQTANVHITLQTEIPDFEVYGGTSKTQFTVSGEYTVEIPAHTISGCSIPRYDIFARRKSNGREWPILTGKIFVNKRQSNVSGEAVSPKDYYVTIPIVESGVQGKTLVVGIPGDSAYEVARLNGFEGTSEEWLEDMRQQTATLAVEQVTPLMERAEVGANNAEVEAQKALKSEQAAAGYNTAAAGEVTKAAAEVDKAKQERETAAGHANAATKSAQDALANQQGAEQAAQDAALAQVAAQNAKTDAEAAKVQAQTAEGNAKASANAAAADKAAAETAKTQAQAAQSKAEQEAAKAEQNAALLGDAALQGRNNTFEAGTTQTVNGIGVFNGEVVVNGDISGTGVEYLRAMEALRELQEYNKGVFKSVYDGKTIRTRQEKVFSTTASDGDVVGFYYLERESDNNTKACMLLRYDKTCGVELGATAFDICAKVYPSQENSLFSNVWGEAGNSRGCFSSAFIYGAHLYIKQSHATNKGHFSISVYDLGENEVLKKTNKLVWYLGSSFSDNIKVAIWGLVGEELQLVTSFMSGVVYWNATSSGFVLKGSASNVYAARDATPQLNSYVISKNAEAENKSYSLANNDVSAETIATLEAVGGEFVINFSPDAGCNWTIEHLPEWLSADVSEIENGGQLVLTVLPNDGAARTGYMRFKSVGNHAFGYPCTIHNDVKQNGV